MNSIAIFFLRFYQLQLVTVLCDVMIRGEMIQDDEFRCDFDYSLRIIGYPIVQ